MYEGRERYAFIGKWAGYLFILVIVGIVANIMTQEFVLQLIPAFSIPGSVLDLVSTLGYGLILLKMGAVEEGYKTAGVFSLITAGLGVGSLLFASIQGVAIVIAIISLVTGLIAEYHEYMAHSTIYVGIDNDMSMKWEELWKWYIGALIATFVCTVLAVIIPVVGAILLLIVAIVSIGLAILKIAYLHKTAQFFKGYAAN